MILRTKDGSKNRLKPGKGIPLNVHSSNYYQRLDLSANASRDDVKHAYSRAVREYNPERHPEEFKRVREAYETLYDPEARSEYDATSNPAVSAAVECGHEALENEDYERAVESFKKALVISPQAHYVRNLLALSYLYASRDQEALQQFVNLTQSLPQNALYWTHRGTTERRLSSYDAAERSFRRALDLDPENSDAIQGLANAVFFQDRQKEAERILQDAIHSDGVVDFDDFSFFFELITQKVIQGDVESVRDLTRRVEASLREPWQKERVAYRFATLAHQLVELNAFELALTIAERSHALLPNDEAIRDLTEAIRSHHETIDQMGRLREDPLIRDGFKFALATLIRSYFGWWESEQEKDEWTRNALIALVREASTLRSSKAGWTLKDELIYIRKNYPAVGEVIGVGVLKIIDEGSNAPTHIWVNCPHCGYEARAAHESANFSCPQCRNNFSYDQQNGQTSTVVQQGSSCLLMFVGFFLLMFFLSFLG